MYAQIDRGLPVAALMPKAEQAGLKDGVHLKHTKRKKCTPRKKIQF